MAVALLQPDVKSNQDYSPGIVAIDSASDLRREGTVF
jgi:hypothetical protein